jgi:hypothetical protein
MLITPKGSFMEAINGMAETDIFGFGSFSEKMLTIKSL